MGIASGSGRLISCTVFSGKYTFPTVAFIQPFAIFRLNALQGIGTDTRRLGCIGVDPCPWRPGNQVSPGLTQPLAECI